MLKEYVDRKLNEIDCKFRNQESTLRNEKNNKCDAITRELSQARQKNEQGRKTVLTVGEIVSFIVSICISNAIGSGWFIITVILCSVTYAVVSSSFSSSLNNAESTAKAKMESLERQLQQDLAQLNARKNNERIALQNDINSRMNQYCVMYQNSMTTRYIINWIIHVFSVVIANADRSAWLPQVRASLKLTVSNTTIQGPNNEEYDLAEQGIHIDDNPMAVGALAYVLEQLTLAEAKRRFLVDPNGGKPAFSSARNDTDIEIKYSAPNGKAKAAP